LAVPAVLVAAVLRGLCPQPVKTLGGRRGRCAENENQAGNRDDIPHGFIPDKGPRQSSRASTPARSYFRDTNGTAEPGTIVVGSTPFQRSACTSVTRFGLVPSAFARASMAEASASPVILMLEALASPFSRSASALACAS